MTTEKQPDVKIWDGAPGYDFIQDIDFAVIPSWFQDGPHSIPPLTTMAAYQWARFCGHGLK